MRARFIFAALGASLAFSSLVNPPVVSAHSPSALVIAQVAAPTSEPVINQRSRLIAYWVLISSLLVGALAIAVGVYQRDRNERWYRIEFLRKAVKEFEQDPEIWKALKILDFEEYRDYEITYRNQRIAFQVNNELLYAALSSHEERRKRKQEIDALQAEGKLDEATLKRYQIETALRDWFNKMLNGLEHFGYFVESGMFSANEIRPWMIYWIRLIADRSYKRPGASKFYDQLYTYIHDYGFSGVIKLFEKFGYRILPTPYTDTDFIEVSKRLDGFDVKVALSLAKTAYLIYEDLSYVAEISSQRWGVEVKNNFRYINNRDRDTQAFMFKTPDFVVLSFRGSQERKDWQTNFSTRLKKFAFKTEMEALNEDVTPPKGQVHRGFQAAWNSVEIEVIKQIRQWNKDQSQPLPILITGHSLGGALATVAAASLVKRGFNVQGLYTFGQPRVGDLIFVTEIGQILKGKAFRFVNNNDIVPRIPPSYLPWNPLRIYVHMGQMFYFDARGNLTTRPNPLMRAIDLFFGLIRDAFEPGFDAINDHRMEFYISNLKKALEVEQEKEKMLLQEAKDQIKQ